MSNILTNNINPRSGNLITIGGTNDRVSIAGTLSYEDVANIDSVGIITARDGLDTPTNLVLRTGGTEQVRIDSGGNVLVGKTITGISTVGTRISSGLLSNTGDSSSTNLAVNAGGSIQLANNNSTDNNFSNIGGYNSNGLVVSQIDFINKSHSSRTGDIAFLTHNGTSMLERMRIDGSGRLQIACTNGTEPVNIVGAGSGVQIARFESGTPSLNEFLGIIGFQGYLNGSNSGSSEASIYAQASENHSGSTAGTNLVFNTKNSGTGPGSSPTARMRINADGRVNIFASSTVGQIVATSRAAGSTEYIFLGRYAATAIETGVSCYAIYTNGTFQQLSDANLKKNIQTTRNGYLDDLNRLRVVKYNWISQNDSEPKELGLIAQEVEQIFPGLVSELDQETENPHKGIKTSVLPYMLLKALQEAAVKIETLEQRLTDAGL